jgi:hypothetical protein
MSDKKEEQEIEFLSRAEALKIVAAIQEEEDIHHENRRVLTVYSYDDKELCWFDFDEVMEDVGEVEAGERKEAVQNYILNRIPTWVLDI